MIARRNAAPARLPMTLPTTFGVLSDGAWTPPPTWALIEAPVVAAVGATVYAGPSLPPAATTGESVEDAVSEVVAMLSAPAAELEARL